MVDKEQLLQKVKAQLFERQNEIENLKSKFAGAGMIANPELMQLVTSLEMSLEEAKEKVAKCEDLNQVDWETLEKEAEDILELVSHSLLDFSEKYA